MRLLCNLLIPLILFSYASRILGPSGLGKVEYANSIVSYFILFAALGIPMYGSREIARSRNNDSERSKVVFELTIILIVTTGIGYIAYFIIIRSILSLYEHWLLFFVIAPAIFLSSFSYEWFYIGIEDQLYITIRFIFIKIIQLILIFFFVKSPDDFVIYAGIIVGMNSISTLFNIIKLKQYIYFVPIKQLNIKRHLKPALLIFSSGVASSIYMHLDVTMVGIMVGDDAVGLYTAANKLIRLISAFIFSLPTVMIPRLENYLKNGNREEYKDYLDKSLRFILCLCIPCTLGMVILSPEIIRLFAGESYSESILSIRLLSPIILITGLIQFVGFQILLINRKEKHFTIAVVIAAIVNGFFNFFMIPIFKQNGAILGTVLAELSVLIIQSIFAWKLLQETELFSFNTVKYFVAGTIMFFSVFFIKIKLDGIILPIIICIFMGAFIYTVALVILHEKTIIIVMKNILKKRKIFLRK
jgi:O-antigen/teichoic acid export membrane protein